MRAARSVHLILFDLIILIRSVNKYKLCRFSLCNFLQSPVTSSLLNPGMNQGTDSLDLIGQQCVRELGPVSLYRGFL
jgi:hypothetical protein